MKFADFDRSFTSIAPYYDTLMSFVNYPAWVDYIEKIFALRKFHEKTLFDLACGTGVCLELWNKKDYRIIGLDKSLTMLKMCKQRFQESEDRDILLINGDMRNFALRMRVPIVTCLYDSLNYLLTEGDLFQCFRCIYDALRANGLLIFDMNTIHCLRDEWGNTTFYRQDRKINSVWTNSFDLKTSISSLQLTLKIKRNGRYLTIKEFHQERGYPLSLVTRLLQEAGFTVSLYRHLTFDAASEQELRIMGVAQKC